MGVGLANLKIEAAWPFKEKSLLQRRIQVAQGQQGKGHALPAPYGSDGLDLSSPSVWPLSPKLPECSLRAGDAPERPPPLPAVSGVPDA